MTFSDVGAGRWRDGSLWQRRNFRISVWRARRAWRLSEAGFGLALAGEEQGG